jgi:hypothetical protein
VALRHLRRTLDLALLLLLLARLLLLVVIEMQMRTHLIRQTCQLQQARLLGSNSSSSSSGVAGRTRSGPASGA